MISSSLSGKQLKNWRVERGWSQVLAARVIGIGVGSLRNYEAGVRSDSDGNVAEIPLPVAWACSAISAGLKPMGDKE